MALLGRVCEVVFACARQDYLSFVDYRLCIFFLSILVLYFFREYSNRFVILQQLFLHSIKCNNNNKAPF